MLTTVPTGYRPCTVDDLIAGATPLWHWGDGSTPKPLASITRDRRQAILILLPGMSSYITVDPVSGRNTNGAGILVVADASASLALFLTVTGRGIVPALAGDTPRARVTYTPATDTWTVEKQ